MKQGWEIKKLGEVCRLMVDGDWIESKDQSDNGIRLLQTGNVGIGCFKDKSEHYKFISEETFDRLNCTEIFEGDILISRLPEPIGRACIVPALDCRMITAVDCSIIRLKDIVLPKYVVYYTRSNKYGSSIEQYVTGAVRKRISRSNLAKIPIPVPERAEQERIVGELDCLSGIIAAKRAQLRELDTLAQSIFYTMFGDPITNDKGWQTKKLGDVATYINGYAFKPEHWTDEGMPIIRIQNLNNQDAGYNYCNMDIPKKFIVEYGDILISWSASLGVYEWVGKRSYLNQHIFKVVFDKYNINKYFFRYIVSGNLNEMLKNAHGATMKHIVKKDFDNTKIITPPIDLQQQFAEKIENIERQKELITKSIKETEDLFNSRMSYYFN